MPYCRALYTYKSHFVAAILLASLLSPISVYAADTSTVYVVSPDEPVVYGQQFTVDIDVNPTQKLVGIQFNLHYDPEVVSIEHILEGNLLNQDGDATFFNPGEIDSTTGTVSRVFAAILSPGKTVSKPGTLATITCTALTATGQSSFTLSNVIIGDLMGQPLPVSTIDNSVFFVDSTGTAERTDTSGISGAPISGGGGEGGGTAGNKRFTAISSSASQDGILWKDVRAYSVDKRAELNISKGTVVLNGNGYLPHAITITTMKDEVSISDTQIIVGNVYDFSPAGVTCEPAANLTLFYEENILPEGIGERLLSLATMDTETGTWVSVPGEVDIDNNCISAAVSHFSSYVILAGIRPASFVYNDLTLTPGIPTENEKVTASALVTNTGDLRGILDLVCTVDDVAVGRENITLEGRDRITVSFTFTAGPEGQHTLKVGTITRSITYGRKEVTTGTIAELDQNSIPGNEAGTQPATEVVVTAHTPTFTTEMQSSIPSDTQPQKSLYDKRNDDNWIGLVITIASGGIFLFTVFVLILYRRHPW